MAAPALPEGVSAFQAMMVSIKAEALSMIERIESEPEFLAENRAPLSLDEARMVAGEGDVFRILLAVPVSHYQSAVRDEEEFDFVHGEALGFGRSANSYITIHATVEGVHFIEYGADLGSVLKQAEDDAALEDPVLVPIQYPVSEKLAGVGDDRDAILEFLEGISQKGILLASYQEVEGFRDEMLMPIITNPDSLVMQHFGIDETKLERERRDMLKPRGE